MVTGIMDAFNYIAIGISIAGSIIIIWGILITIFSLLIFEKDKIVNPKLANGSEVIRHKLGAYLLLGLDFTLAADIIHTIHNPVLKELYVLAMIVGIRSIINFFLLKELASIKSNKPDLQSG
ncbi:DUF1622 domain-containing protein [Ilyomonas limi]|uniref:DUF1622 domain-containing protein n=1 Tax=Ilyomonas limi TaxID=2575867 RepID=A0A4U3KV77_9BACT|nr:DUF1622 domain-containing protein [Ilyomonas limi]TKK66310.1 DUF1622 domain-containing protein [Ilyomonas limi]